MVSGCGSPQLHTFGAGQLSTSLEVPSIQLKLTRPCDLGRTRRPSILQEGVALMFKTSNLRLMCQRHANFVKPVQQAVAAERFDDELFREAAIIGDGLALKVDDQLIRPPGLGLLGNVLYSRFRGFDEQQAVVARVNAEDVSIGRSDDGADAELRQRPRRVLAR